MPAPSPKPSDRPISELFAEGRPLRSIEFFPPKDELGVEALGRTATALQRIGPDFVSVTYGAGEALRNEQPRCPPSSGMNSGSRSCRI